MCYTYEWATILGVSVKNTNETSNFFANTVDCLLTLGTVEIIQTGADPPILNRTSFRGLSNTSVKDGSLNYMRTMYHNGRSPFNFSAGRVKGSNGDTIYSNPFALHLLHSQANSSAEDVASRIEGIFEMRTLVAFVRSPEGTVRTITETTVTRVYAQDRRVLAILVIPLLTTILGTSSRYRIVGDDVCVGYNPNEIARRGQFPGSEDEGMRPMEIRSEEKN
ncbi:hypothetical protein BU24DRAFT_473455 [Aaosphaeria arxii CBS 175.79]|uniref:Uncharacterized protein n=1 Tax=Aaosphaeria arxii CBS 175.79 TaxID=1450172 RepID=A0A6A5X9C4_9PLEO|nr:uncharacterized protein BU24DRAFT_473455 [Aaosphaeria arxii CBS 175.79]KAF2009344.1 hypothetical protein BU24DRAFT_473455 [Aaosphaeria arxii CBS 175.79]